jgi:hypothetical protein
MPLRLFSGRCPQATRKKSKTSKQTATAASYGEEAGKTRCREGAPQEIGLEASGKGRFRSPLRASLPGPEQQAWVPRAPLSFARVGDEHTYPFRSQMAKVELKRLSGKSYARANLLTISLVIAA